MFHVAFKAGRGGYGNHVNNYSRTSYTWPLIFSIVITNVFNSTHVIMLEYSIRFPLRNKQTNKQT